MIQHNDSKVNVQNNVPALIRRSDMNTSSDATLSSSNIKTTRNTKGNISMHHSSASLSPSTLFGNHHHCHHYLFCSMIVVLVIIASLLPVSGVNGQYTLHSVSTILTLSGQQDCSIYVLEKFTFSFSSPFSVISRQLPSPVGMPSGNLVIDKNSDIFVDSPQVSLSTPSILISADGKTIVFRVYFVDGRELMNYDKVTLIYGYNLLRGPMKTEDFLSQLRWHNSFSIPVSNISFKFFYENGILDQRSIKANRDYYSYSQSVSGTTYNILEFNSTNVTTGSLFVGAFNATNLKYSTCLFEEQQSDNLFFYSIIVPLLIGFALVLLLSLIVILFQRCCRRRSSVVDHEIARSHPSNNSRNYTSNSPTVVTPMKEQEIKAQQTGLYYVTNTFNNVENNDGFTGVVVSHLNETPNSVTPGPSAGVDEIVIQYTPTLNTESTEPEQTV